MEEQQYKQMKDSLSEAIRTYRKCYIANCDCDEYEGEWKEGCFCMGHWKQLNKEFGKDSWSFNDAIASAKAGKPIRA